MKGARFFVSDIGSNVISKSITTRAYFTNLYSMRNNLCGLINRRLEHRQDGKFRPQEADLVSVLQ